MRKGHRFLGKSLAALAGMVAAGRVVSRRDGTRPDPAADDHLGAIRGEARHIRGPRASRVYTEVFEPADGHLGTIVFTHGLCLTEAVWHYQKRDLPGDGARIVTWDLPGHGHSDAVAPGEFTRELAVDALARVIDEHAGSGGVVLVGHSLGGVVTLDYLARHPAAARVRGTVLVSTPMMHFAHSVAGRWPGARVEARALGKIFQYVVESDLVDRYLHRDVGRDGASLPYRVIRVGFGKNASPSQIRYVRDVIASVPPQVRADAYRAMTGFDVRGHAIAHPTLVVIGERDRLVNPEESRALADRLPKAETLVLADVGHAAFLEAPNAFNAAVREFAEEHLTSGGRPEAGSA